MCAFLAVRRGDPAGIFAASTASRLQFLGVGAAGVTIGLFGGIATAVMMMAASSALWVMAQPGIAEDRAVLQALYWLVQGFGGAGFSVPFGLLVAGVTIPAAFTRLIPRWIAALGIAIAIVGELSWFYLMIPDALPLVPLTRFPGFVWLIAIGLALPTSIETSSPTCREREHESCGARRVRGRRTADPERSHPPCHPADQRRLLGRTAVAAQTDDVRPFIRPDAHQRHRDCVVRTPQGSDARAVARHLRGCVRP